MKSFLLKLSLLEPDHCNVVSEFKNPYDVSETFQLLAKDKKFMSSLEKYYDELMLGLAKLNKLGK